MKTFILTVCLSVSALGQAVSPIGFSVKLDRETNLCSLVEEDSRPLVNFTVELAATKDGKPLNSELRVDRFFAKDNKITGNFSMQYDCEFAGALVTVKFLQFVDGTYWGPAALAKSLADRRKAEIKDLQKSPISENLRMRYSLKRMTPDEIELDIKERLALAQLHKSWLDALQ